MDDSGSATFFFSFSSFSPSHFFVERGTTGVSTYLRCKAPAGVGDTLDLTASSPGLSRSLLTRSATYAASRVISAFPVNGPATGVASVTFSGVGFGTRGYTQMVRVGGTNCMAVKWVSDSSVVCRLPSGYSQDQAVILSVAGTRSAATSGAAGIVFKYDPRCGDGFKYASEQCDDGNLAKNDGCSDTCTIEAGYVCFFGSSNSRDQCTRCGDGFKITNGNEVCDDFNTENGDGCSSICTIEAGFQCGPSPQFPRADLCSCLPDFYGPSCNVQCVKQSTCNNRGTCSPATGKCVCDNNYFGETCSVSSSPSATQTATLFSSGGLISVGSSTASASLTFPLGALSQPTPITASVYTGLNVEQLYPLPSTALKVASPIYEFGPNGAQFPEPIQMSLGYTAPTGIAGTPTVYWYDEGLRAWVAMNMVKRDGTTATASVSHFSKFAVLFDTSVPSGTPSVSVSSSSSPSTGSQSLSTGAIVGIVLGGLVLLVATTVIAVLATRSRRRRFAEARSLYTSNLDPNVHGAVEMLAPPRPTQAPLAAYNHSPPRPLEVRPGTENSKIFLLKLANFKCMLNANPLQTLFSGVCLQ